VPRDKRTKPENANWYGWEAFERWADVNGIEKGKADWMPWWRCWKKAYTCAMNY
jgi:hypothetical protein